MVPRLESESTDELDLPSFLNITTTTRDRKLSAGRKVNLAIARLENLSSGVRNSVVPWGPHDVQAVQHIGCI